MATITTFWQQRSTHHVKSLNVLYSLKKNPVFLLMSCVRLIELRARFSIALAFVAFIMFAMLLDLSTAARVLVRCCIVSKLWWHRSRNFSTSSMMARYICLLFSTCRKKFFFVCENCDVNQTVALWSSTEDAHKFVFCRHAASLLGLSHPLILVIIMLPVATATAMTQASFVEQHFPHFDHRLCRRCCCCYAVISKASLNFLNAFSRRFYGSPRAKSDRAVWRNKRKLFMRKKLDMSLVYLLKTEILIRRETTMR